jgi:N utilization substance protein A
MSSLFNAEILQIAESVAKEKGISKEVVIHAMEQAIQTAGKRKYGNEHNIRAEINRKTGEISLEKVLDVVEIVEDTFTQISLQDVKITNPDLKLGDIVTEPLPPIDLGRLAAQSAKQVIVQKVREAERDKQYNDFKDRIGEILNGVVKRMEFGDITIDLGRTEAVIKKDQLIRGESFRINDRVKAYVQDVRKERKGPQIFLSRTDNGFLAKLLEIEVPEIYDKIITIKSVAREPGSKAKVAVFTSDFATDPVGTCVGPKGSRVRAVTEELCGEKIDLIAWSDDLAQMAINALAPAEVSRVVIDNDKRKIDVVVAEDQLNLAIGKRGQNVRLASKLIGWNLGILSEDQESKRRTERFNNAVELFVSALEIEEMMAQLLTVEGYSTIEQIAATDPMILAKIEGFDDELAGELVSRAIEFVDKQNEEMLTKLETLGVEQDLLDSLYGLDVGQILALAEAGVKTIEDLAEVKFAEFKSIVKDAPFSDDEIEALLLAAKNTAVEAEAEPESE